MKPCRNCGQLVSEAMPTCPNCGISSPIRALSEGRGFEYRSEAKLFGFPLLHVSFKYRAGRKPVPAKGVIAIGQFAFGIVTISQFGIGVFSLSQFTIGGWCLAQFALAYALIAQFGLYVDQGHGQLVMSFAELSKLFR